MMKKTPHRQNIALESAALFYDPTYLKMSLYVDSNGNAGPRQSYDYPGAEVLPNGDVVFTFYAPQAHRVAVCGLPDTTMTDTLHEMHPI